MASSANSKLHLLLGCERVAKAVGNNSECMPHLTRRASRTSESARQLIMCSEPGHDVSKTVGHLVMYCTQQPLIEDGPGVMLSM